MSYDIEKDVDYAEYENLIRTHYADNIPLAERVFKLYRELNCRGCARIDFIVDRRKGPAVLEVNTLPALTETSALPASAKAAGISFEELVIKIISYGLHTKR